MPNRKYSVEQIVAKLREHEKLQGQGLTVVQACKRIGVSGQTFFRWPQRYGALKEDEAHRLRSWRPKTPGSSGSCRPDARHRHAQGPPKVKILSPSWRRKAVQHLVRHSLELCPVVRLDRHHSKGQALQRVVDELDGAG